MENASAVASQRLQDDIMCNKIHQHHITAICTTPMNIYVFATVTVEKECAGMQSELKFGVYFWKFELHSNKKPSCR